MRAPPTSASASTLPSRPRWRPPAIASSPTPAATVGPPTLPALARDPSKFAVVIGIAKYKRDLPASTGSDNDAQAFAELLEKQLGVPRQNIWLLLGDDATKSSIDANLFEQL